MSAVKVSPQEGGKETIRVTTATEQNVSSLSTIVPRSFHPVNPFIKTTLPDTPLVGQWWAKVFTAQIQSPSHTTLLAVDVDSGEVVGVLWLRFCNPEETGAGIWTDIGITPDHDAARFEAMVHGMVTNRERFMLGQSHISVELFGCDHAHQGKGIGKKLLSKACQIADEKGQPAFVQANHTAAGFYEKFGFELKDKVDMPGDIKYSECFLVRPAGKPPGI